MPLKTLFAIPIAVISLVTLLLAGTIAGHAWSGYQRGAVAIRAVERMRMLVLLQTDLWAERVATNAALELESASGITVGAEALSLDGTGVSNGGALRNVSGTNTWQGLITLAAAAEIQSDAGTLTLDPATGDAVTGTFALTVDGAGAVTVSDPIEIGRAHV